MKQLIILTILSLFSSVLFAQKDTIKSDSKITDVIVFREGAQINRNTKIKLSKGSNIVVFTDLSTFIDEESSQVKTGSNTTILSVKHRINYFDKPEKKENIVKLEERKEEIKLEIEETNVLIQVYKEEESLIIQNNWFGGTKNNVSATELDSASVLFRTRLTETRIKLLEFNKKISDYYIETTKINNQLKELNNTKGEKTGELVVVVVAEKATTEDFSLNYVVSNAGWTPKYDIRVDDISKPLNLMSKADVFQQTGYDWENVNMTLSTGNPYESGEKPLMATWFLDFGYNNYYYQDQNKTQIVNTNNTYNSTRTVNGIIIDEDGQPIPGAIIYIENFEGTGTVSDFDGYYTLEDIPADAKVIVYSSLGKKLQKYNLYEMGSTTLNATLLDNYMGVDEIVVTGIGIKREEKALGYAVTTMNSEEITRNKDKSKIGGKKKGKPGGSGHTTLQNPPDNILAKKQTSMEYILEKPYTINSDNKKHAVEIKEYEVDADYKYYCVPKMENTAFLSAEIADWELYNLLSGKTNLFFEGTYIGKSELDVQNAKDTIIFSLGRDNDIVIKYEKLTDFTKKQYIGTNIIETFAYEISVRNTKSQAIDIIIEDQFPMPQHNDITVKQIETSEAKLDEDSGKLIWETNLKALETKKFTIKFSVKYPKNKKINL